MYLQKPDFSITDETFVQFFPTQNETKANNIKK